MTWLRAAFAAAILAIAAVFCGTAYRVWRIESELELLLEEMSDMTLKTTWKSEGGLDHTVESKQADGETADQHAARHKAMVDAMKELFPPVN